MAAFAAILGDITLALNVAGQLTPLINGIMTGITKITNAQGEVEYTVLIKSGQESLDQSANNFKSALDKINEERARQNLPALDVPEFSIPDTPAPLPPQTAKRAPAKKAKAKSRRR